MPDDNVYSEVNTLQDVRRINSMIRRDMSGARSRDRLTELKKRADYLCTLTYSPAWHEKLGKRASRFLEVAKAEDEKTTEKANQVARRHKWSGEYNPWGGGD
jgi:hypothetical protein